MNEFWQSCVIQLEQNLPPQQISAWIKPLAPVEFNNQESVLIVSAPNRFKLDWVRKNFSLQIEQLASEWYGKKISVNFVLPKPRPNNNNNISAPRPTSPNITVSPPQTNHTNQPNQEPIIGSEYDQDPQSLAISDSILQRSHLHTDLRFDNFVTGKANQLARAAALQVTENPGVSYNPLFLYGGVGLGKTHLIHAVGNALLEKDPTTKVKYVHADRYVSDVVKAYQRKAFDEFKRAYHSLDLLLIDDIQFFGGKARTQEEFFYAFEAMVAQRKQIIITSDTYPKELPNIDSRLISRFDSGLTVAIEPPELEMRVAILLRKAQYENITMPEEVAFFIAKHLRSNIRELEGALRKVLAYVRFHGREVLTVEICRDALRDLLSVSSGQINVENIQKTVADFYKIKIADMYSKRRTANIALPRQIAMYLAKELTQKSLPEIGNMFGGRDHTTVLYAVRKITLERAKNAELNHALHVLEQTLKG